MKIRYKKVIRDLTSDYTKNLMLVLAIAIGVFGIGTILGGYAVLKREMARNYLGTNPASATIRVEDDSLQSDFVNEVKKLNGISEAERHATISARMKIGERWFPLLLFVKDDFNNLRTNKISFLSGSKNPLTGTMLVEKTALRVMKSESGKEIIIKTPNGNPKSIRITGIVHDPTLAPAWQEQTGYAYITSSTLKWLGENNGLDELRIVFKNSNQTSDMQLLTKTITNKAKQVAAMMQKSGYKIHEIQVPPPNKHPHQGQMNAVLYLFVIFSFLVLILSSVLVGTSIATLMVKQVREIGIMKTIGGKSFQVSGLYLVMIMIISVAALLIAIPLSRITAALFYKQIAVLLNLQIFDGAIPHWVLLVQILSGILIPLFAAAVPIIKGSSVTVRKAMDNYGISINSFKKNFLADLLLRLKFFGEMFSLSIRNIFRTRSRLIMSLILLAAGGAMFMTALNVSSAWDTNLSKISERRFYDIDIRLNKPVQISKLDSIIAKVQERSITEEWGISPSSFYYGVPYDITNVYPDKGHGNFSIIGTPPETKLIKLPILKGRWLSASDKNDVVLNQMALALMPQLKVGDSVSLFIDDKPVKWKIVGIVEDIYTFATAYVPVQSFQMSIGLPGSTNMIRIAFSKREIIQKKTKAIEDLLIQNNISVNQNISTTLFRDAISEHMGILVNSLIAMAILMALVGTLGLTSTMSINIMERTREIGVMRAIGATPKKIFRLVISEELIIASMSIFIAFLLSLAMSIHLGEFLGTMSFRTPLSLAISVKGIITWIFIIISGSIGSTFFPARRAGSITTREALSYE